MCIGKGQRGCQPSSYRLTASGLCDAFPPEEHHKCQAGSAPGPFYHPSNARRGLFSLQQKRKTCGLAGGVTWYRRMLDGLQRRGGIWVGCQGVLLLAVMGGGLVWRNQWCGRASATLGLILLVIAAVCGLAGTVSLGKQLTPFPQPSRTAKLVRNGIYALMRHPLYTAVFTASVGWGLLRHSWPALASALLLGPFFDAKARVEERALRERFSEYTDYERRVKKFIPWVY